MPVYDFSKQLIHRRTDREFTTNSIGLGGIEGLWNTLLDYAAPIQVGTVFELLLLYTIDRQAQQRPAPNNVLSEQDKRERNRLALKVCENSKLELDDADVKLLRRVITVLGTEPHGIVEHFLDDPET